MLILTRKPRQSIMIGDEVEVALLSVTGEEVRLGIQAPRRIPVYRTEIYRELAQQNPDRSAHADVDAALKRLSRDP